MTIQAQDSYAGMSYGEIFDTRSDRPHAALYTHSELITIHRKFRRLGKLIAQGRRIPDERQGQRKIRQ